jgi:glucosamine-6-phosphate deaminase
MRESINKTELFQWCSIPAERLLEHPDRRVPLRICDDAPAMAQVMAQELVQAVISAQKEGRTLRTILPCGPNGWLRPFTDLVNSTNLSLENLLVFHMDECLDWEGGLLPIDHPYNFRGHMERQFYGPVRSELRVPEKNRRWLTPATYRDISEELRSRPADLVYGGWGQDGHVAYNQARRNQYSPLTVEELRQSSARVQENNPDTIIALSQRTFGGAYQFVPPMSVTLGMSEILSASRVRLFSDTGAWKQTALRVALFGPLTPDYPLTLLQGHPDALLTATSETSQHPVSLHPEWDLGLIA